MSTRGNISLETIESGAGPMVAILAGVHGDERCGIEAFSLIPSLNLKRGKVIFVKANLAAIGKGVRFCESDLNRAFTGTPDTLEGRTAKRLMGILDSCDAMLDIHASFCKGSEPFVICERHSLGIARSLPAGIVLTGLDRFHSGSTDHYMNQRGKTGICIECGYLGDDGCVSIAKEAILSFLSGFGMVQRSVMRCKQEVLCAQKLFVNTRGMFRLARPFRDVEKLDSPEIVGTEDGREVWEKGYIFFAKDSDSLGSECYLMADEA